MATALADANHAYSINAPQPSSFTKEMPGTLVFSYVFF